MSELDKDAIYRWTPFEKWEYQQIIHAPEGDLDVLLRLDFYEAAKSSVQRLVDGPNDIEGAAALYLFRHYLELTLKALVVGSRHLKTREENMPAEIVLPPSHGHDLLALWDEVKKQVPKKLGAGVWPKWDHQFAEQCITEFHVLDPSSERLRYRRGKKDEDRDRLNPVRVDWSTLLYAMQHVHDVLEAIDSYLIETHGQNADWEAEMNSWL